jgi:hypothetical protein
MFYFWGRQCRIFRENRQGLSHEMLRPCDASVAVCFSHQGATVDTAIPKWWLSCRWACHIMTYYWGIFSEMNGIFMDFPRYQLMSFFVGFPSRQAGGQAS